MTTTAVIRAVGYSRVSDPKQVEDEETGEEKVSLKEQRADIEEFCASRGYVVVDWYEDAGLRGSSKNRPAFKRMLKDAKGDKYDVIVCWKSDRLSRGTYPATALIQSLEGTDIKLESVKDVIDLDTFELYAWVGKRELKAISERVRMGHRGRAKAGYVTGHVAYGYQLEGTKKHKIPAVNEEEAEVVRLMFSLYTSGMGCYSVAERLREMGILTRTGKQWTTPRVWDTIKDAVYVGRGYYGKTQPFYRDNGEKDVRHLRKTPEKTWIEIPYPPIIDEETWNKAQEQLKHQVRRREPGKFDKSHMLKGLLWCGKCTARYTTSTSKGNRTWKRRDGTVMRRRRQTPHTMYICFHSANGAKCFRPRIGSVSIEESVWKTVCSFIRERWRVEALIEERKRQIQESGTIPELDKARKQLEALKLQEQRALDLYLSGSYNRDYLDQKLEQVRDSQAYHQGVIRRLERECAGANRAVEMLSSFLAATQHIEERLDTMTRDERVDLVHIMVDRVIVWGPKEADVEVVMALDFGMAASSSTNVLQSSSYTTIPPATRRQAPRIYW